MYRVFVYGTLKRYQPNYKRVMVALGDSVTYLGEARTVDKFPLVVGTDYNVPFLLYQAGKGKSVHGELYEVDKSALQILDDFEQVGDLYSRREIAVQYCGREERAWSYVYERAGPRTAAGACLEMYDDEMAKDDMKYVDSSKRTKNLRDLQYQLQE